MEAHGSIVAHEAAEHSARRPSDVEAELHRVAADTNLWRSSLRLKFDLVVTARFTVSCYDYFSD